MFSFVLFWLVLGILMLSVCYFFDVLICLIVCWGLLLCWFVLACGGCVMFVFVIYVCLLNDVRYCGCLICLLIVLVVFFVTLYYCKFSFYEFCFGSFVCCLLLGFLFVFWTCWLLVVIYGWFAASLIEVIGCWVVIVWFNVVMFW